jgi:UDP-galactopyranose mutase
VIADYIVVGSGLTGATIARLLADAGRDVIVLERRGHLGGNVHDSVHDRSGIRIHTYGPHYFRTRSRRIWDYVTRFAEFYPFEARVRTLVDGMYEHWPVLESYISRVAGSSWAPTFSGTPMNFEEACLAIMPQPVFEKFVKGYTEKQWGVPTAALSAELARRVDVRRDDDTRLFRHPYQGLPIGGYAQWIAPMLDGIPIVTHTDYLTQRDAWQFRQRLIFTGAIDEFFGYSLGRLKYRSQRRTHSYYPHRDHVLPCGQINTPDETLPDHVRLLEWKYMMEPWLADRLVGTIVTAEAPFTAEAPDTYEYPFPDDINRQLFARYAKMAHALPNVTICGRLGEYRYYDMDQAIGRAMKIATDLLRG